MSSDGRSAVVFYLVESEERAELIRQSELVGGQEATLNGGPSVDRQVSVLVVDSPEADARAILAVGGAFAEAAAGGAFAVELHDVRRR